MGWRPHASLDSEGEHPGEEGGHPTLGLQSCTRPGINGRLGWNAHSTDHVAVRWIEAALGGPASGILSVSNLPALSP
jgi:hypothetical protein